MLAPPDRDVQEHLVIPGSSLSSGSERDSASYTSTPRSRSAFLLTVLSNPHLWDSDIIQERFPSPAWSSTLRTGLPFGRLQGPFDMPKTSLGVGPPDDCGGDPCPAPGWGIPGGVFPGRHCFSSSCRVSDRIGLVNRHPEPSPFRLKEQGNQPPGFRSKKSSSISAAVLGSLGILPASRVLPVLPFGFGPFSPAGPSSRMVAVSKEKHPDLPATGRPLIEGTG